MVFFRWVCVSDMSDNQFVVYIKFCSFGFPDFAVKSEFFAINPVWQYFEVVLSKPKFPCRFPTAYGSLKKVLATYYSFS